MVEPAGAAGVAALLAEPGAFEPPVVVVLSGGNIDPLLLSKLLRHGLSAACGSSASAAGSPTTLACSPRCSRCWPSLGANVLEVSHERLAPSLRVDEVEVVLQVETRGPAHCEHVKSQLRCGRLRLGFELAGLSASGTGAPGRCPIRWRFLPSGAQPGASP